MNAPPALQDMNAIRAAVAAQRRCRYSGKRLCHTSTVLVTITGAGGRRHTVALHRDAWPQRRPLVEEHFGPENVRAIDGRELFTP
jgi:hypothetical protein